MNSFKARAKKSHLEVEMGKMVIFLFVWQVVFCVFAGLYYMIWYVNNDNEFDYLFLTGLEKDSDIYNFVIIFGSFFLILS